MVVVWFVAWLLCCLFLVGCESYVFVGPLHKYLIRLDLCVFVVCLLRVCCVFVACLLFVCYVFVACLLRVCCVFVVSMVRWVITRVVRSVVMQLVAKSE